MAMVMGVGMGIDRGVIMDVGEIAVVVTRRTMGMEHLE